MRTEGTPPVGEEWVIDAFGCRADALRSPDIVSHLFDCVLRDLGLQAAAPALWHVFPGPGGLTGLQLLQESHLSCHTYPEHGYAAFNLYCCRARVDWPWERELQQRLGAAQVDIRRLARGPLALSLRG